MKININGRNIEVTEGLRGTIEKKLNKFDKFFSQDVDAQVTLTIQKNNHIVEIMIPFNGIVLRAEDSSNDMYKTIDLVVDKLERQVRKQKTKLQRRHQGEGLKFQFLENNGNSNPEEEERRIVKSKRFPLKPMSAEEAILQMELVGHNFFVYIDDSSEDVNVVYKRKDGNYGLIEPEYE
ncbi:MAG: ribosome-associated translation inhibitor RaiA [Oscillospiraceae bacterium]|nr:ribosome-associated translation inhibitor RaiA [Oscillospiraceae bacterium]